MRLSGRFLAVVVSLVTIAIFAVGFGYFRMRERAIIHEAELDLLTINAFKVSQLTDWLGERTGDAEVIAGSPLLQSSIREFVSNPTNLTVRDGLISWLETTRLQYQYESVGIYDPEGRMVLGAPSTNLPTFKEMAAEVKAVLAAGKVRFSDLHRNSPDGAPHLDIMIPTPAQGASSSAVVLLRIDPTRFLFPLVQSWPTSSRSGETELVRVEGAEVLYLNELRFRTNSAMRLRIPITPARAHLLGMGAGGTNQVVTGLDYRGIDCIGASQPVPTTRWILVSKLDRAEVVEPLQAEARLVAVASCIALFAMGTGAGWLWRQEKSHLLAAQLATEHDLRIRETRIASIMRDANDAILIIDGNGRIIEHSRQAMATYGYSREQMVGLLWRDLLPAASGQQHSTDITAHDFPNGVCCESIHRRQDGTVFPVEVSGGAIQEEGGMVYMAIVRDISQRKQNEHALERLNQLYAASSAISAANAHALDADSLALGICRILVESGGLKMAWVGWLDAGGCFVTPKATFGDDSGYTASVRIKTTGDAPSGQGPSGIAFRESRVYVCNDFFSDPNTEPWRDAARTAGFRSSIALPIRRSGKPCGLLCAYAAEQYFFGEKEVRLLIDAAADLSGTLDHLSRNAEAAETRVALKEREELLSMVFDRAMDSIALLDSVSGAFIEFNEAAHRNLGYSREEFASLTLAGLVCDCSGITPNEILGRFRQAEGSVLELRFRNRVKEDRVLSLSGRGLSLRGRECVVVVWTDITSRLQSEAQLKRSEERFRQIFQAAPVPLAYSAPDGRVQSVNDQFTRVFGYTVDDIPDLATWWEKAYPDAGYRVRVMTEWGGKVEAALRSGQSFPPMEVRVTCKDGSVRIVEIAGVVMQSQMLVTFFDLTQRLQAAQQLQLQASALNAAANAILITDVEGRIAWVNSAFHQLTGYAPEAAVGQNPRILKSGVQSREFYENLWQTVKRGEVWHGELKNRRRDGSIYDEEMTITPVRLGGESVTHFVAIKQDITERRSLERQYLRAQRMESVGLLAAGIAHDLNNVLAPILMSMEFLRSSELPDDLAPLVETVEASAKRGADIVKQVLAFARGIEGDKAPVQLRHILKDMARIASETFPRNITIHARVSGDLWLVQADATQMHQVLLNLSVNARDAMPTGGELVMSAANFVLDESTARNFPPLAPGRFVRVEVRDTGCGIPQDVLDRIFEPFFTTKEQGKGTGLGLSTVLGIVRSHDGSITVESTPGQGTKFIVLLPAIANQEPSGPRAQPAEPPRGHNELILLVDDEQRLLQVTETILHRAGYRTLAAHNGVEALALFLEHRTEVDLVITDIMMPVMDGLTLLSQLMKIKPDLRCIACSGLTGQSESVRVEQLRAFGVRHFLQKPFAVDQLLVTLNRALHPPPPA